MSAMHNLSFEQLNEKLLQNCGHYAGVREGLKHDPTGSFILHNCYGMDVVEISCDVQMIKSTASNPPRGDSEHIYLIKQLSGETQIIHNDNDAVVKPGDFVLVDSTKNASLIYLGKRSHFISVHMPRAEFLSRCRDKVEIGKVRSGQSPRGKALNAAFPRVRESDGELDLNMPFETEPDLIFDLVRIAFLGGEKCRSKMRITARDNRRSARMQLLDQNLTNPELSLEWLADAAKISVRQLQREFQAGGILFSTTLNERRLDLVVKKLHRCHAASQNPNIARTAFSCGFSDISNFNRVFKKAYGCSPSEYIVQLSDKT